MTQFYTEPQPSGQNAAFSLYTFMVYTQELRVARLHFSTSSRLYKKVLGSLAVLVLATACQTVQTTNGGVVGVNRQQQMLVGAAEIEQASAVAYSDAIQKAQRAGNLNTDAALAARVRRVAQRLIAQTPAFRPDAKNWKWEVNTIRNDDVNAFCMAGGKIVVYSGLVTRLKLTDDELAAVVGHEIAHALREHVREQASSQQLGQLLALGASVAGLKDQYVGLAGDAFQLYGLKHSRRDETEADLIGVELAARAGYDPRAAVTLWDKMAANGGGRPLEFLSTHPSPENRQAVLRDASGKVLPLYQQKQTNWAPPQLPREQRAVPVATPAKKKRVLKRK